MRLRTPTQLPAVERNGDRLLSSDDRQISLANRRQPRRTTGAKRGLTSSSKLVFEINSSSGTCPLKWPINDVVDGFQ
ncbi:unnamed protein product [Soboliphyme baturini]|uniref:Uncharacterized protein n=1 Tax=Soboliphyme baturini TaxID=241478 RepID=A0A183J162_9BILA|nr:unnamed protein product [Soboliphyme baturini]